MAAKGKGLLKVTGILLIIFGAFGILSSILGMIGAQVLESAGTEVLDAMEAAGVENYSSSAVIVACLITAVAGILYLVSGIIGIVNCNKPERAQICFILGILMIVVQLGTSAYDVAMGNGFNIFYVAISLVLPILYFMGSNWNKNMSTNEM